MNIEGGLRAWDVPPGGWGALTASEAMQVQAAGWKQAWVAGRRGSAETGVCLLLWGLHRGGGCGLGPTGCLGGLLLERRGGPGVTGEADSDSGAGRPTVGGRGGLCFGFHALVGHWSV